MVLVFERNEERTKCKISINGNILEQVIPLVLTMGSMFSRDGRYEMVVNDERMAKKVLNRKVSGKRGRRRLRLIFENTISKTLEEGHVKSMRIPRKACMKRFMRVDEAKVVPM